jgi:hypothetical protein
MTHRLTESQDQALDVIAQLADHTRRSFAAISAAAQQGAPPDQIAADLSKVQHELGTTLMNLQALILDMCDG